MPGAAGNAGTIMTADLRLNASQIDAAQAEALRPGRPPVSGNRRARGAARMAGAALLALGLSCSLAQAQQAALRADDDPEFNALFHESMARPADVELAFRLANRAVKVGDYEAAIGVYERILFYDPRLVRVKLELARLYYRLGSYETARTYFGAIDNNAALTVAEQQNVSAYLVEIDRRLSVNQWSIYGQMGLRYQSNATYGPSSRIVVGDDVAALLPPSYTSQSDGNAFALATVRHVYDFQNQRGDVWESNLNLYYSQQFEIQRLNLGFVEANTGPRLALMPDALPGSSVRGYLLAGGVALGGDGYLGTYGAGASVYLPFAGWFAAEPFAEFRQRDYQDTPEYPTSAFQSGGMWTLGANFSGTISDSTRWRARVAYNNADGELPWYSYTNFAVDVALPIEFQGLWGVRRWVAIPSAGYSNYEYDAANPFISLATARNDDQYRVGLALDMPVYGQVGLLTQVQYSWSTSSLPNYDFDNFSVSVGPNVRF